MATLNFDANNVAPDEGRFGPLPAGWYNVTIDESEMKPTNAGDGAYLKLRFSILDGKYANQKFFHNLNLQNKNAQTVEIAHGQLSAICRAVGVLRVGQSQELHGIPLKVRARIRPETYHVPNDPTSGVKYEASNELTAFKNINEAIPGAPASAGPALGGVAPVPGAFAQPPAPQPWAQPATAPQAPQAPVAGYGQQPPAQPFPTQAPAPSAAPAQQPAPVAAPQEAQQAPQVQQAPQQPPAPAQAQQAPVQAAPAAPAPAPEPAPNPGFTEAPPWAADPAAVQAAQTATPPWQTQ